MKTILVPTDFSREANAALRVASTIARKTGATIQLLHVIQSVYEEQFAASANLPEKGKVELAKQMEKANYKLHKRLQDESFYKLTIIPQIQVGSIFRHISDIIASHDVDLIVMGTKGASGIKEMVVGSNTANVVRHAKCSVLTVRGKTENLLLKNVVLATNLEDVSDSFMKKMQEWQASFHFRIHLLYINTPLHYQTTSQIESRIEKFLNKFPLTNYTWAIVDDYSFEDGIKAYAKKVNADLVSVLTHGRQGLAHLWEGSFTEELVNHSTIPVLAYNIQLKSA